MPNRFPVLLCLMIALCFAAAADWPMAGYDAARTGYNAAETGLAPPFELDWSVPVPGQPEEISVANGRAYVSIGSATGGASYNAVAALDETDGTQDFLYYLYNGSAMMVCPVAAGGGYIFFGGQGDDNFYTLNAASGAEDLLISGMASLLSRPAAYDNGMAYVAAGNAVYGIDPENPVNSWTYAPTFANQLGVTVGGGRVYFADNSVLTAIDQTTGTWLWTSSGAVAAFETPVYCDEMLYVAHALASGGAVVRAYHADTGVQGWETSITCQQLATTSVGALSVADDVVLVGVWENSAGNAELRAYAKSDGTPLWDVEDSAEGMFRPVVANGYVYAPGWNSFKIHVIDLASGAPVYDLDLPVRLNGGITIANGRLYACMGNTVYAYKSEPPQPAPHGCFGGVTAPAAPGPPENGELLLCGLLLLLFIMAAMARRQRVFLRLRK